MLPLAPPCDHSLGDKKLAILAPLPYYHTLTEVMGVGTSRTLGVQGAGVLGVVLPHMHEENRWEIFSDEMCCAYRSAN